MTRTTTTTTETTVTHVAKPMGRDKENGPHLKDLRDFLSECHGMPDDTRIFIEAGHLSESGRRDVTIKATLRVTMPGAEDERA